MEQLNLGIISNNPLSKTGLGRNVKSWLPVIYRTGKYKIFMLNQGQPDNDGNYQKLPWSNEGVFKNFDQNRMNQDPNYQRFVAYGNTAVEDWVIRNKLDVVIASDDAWAFTPETYFKTDWYQHIKHNFIAHITADSEPILPLIKEWAQNCPNIHFWSGFAQRALNEENKELYGHCKLLRGGIEGNDFYPLPKNERLDLRHKFNISDDEKIIMYLGRNQLRKLFFAHMEALKIWRKKFPNKKLRLLFHCSWSEPAGWPLNQIREELGLQKEDVLTTYNCRNCGDWNIQPYDGEELNCGVCNTQKSRITAGVGSNINEKDLNKIYNIADASCSIFTSGGQEYTNVESLLAGLPLACVNYSSGEDFCKNNFVYKINGNFTRECGTSFKKFVPDINSVVDFYEYIYNLSEDEKRKISHFGREWALKEFDAPNIAKQIETFLDSCKRIDWDSYLAKKSELKNPNAQIPNIQDDKEWLKTLYKEVLKMDVKDDDSGLLFWIGELTQKKRSRPDIDNYFRSVGHQENLKKNNVGLDSLLEKDDKERVLLTLKESMGDHFLLTALLPEIKNKYPEAAIYIGCEQKYFDIYENNPYIKKCIPWMPEMDNEMQMTGFGGHKGLFNYYHNVGIGTQKLLNYLSSKY